MILLLFSTFFFFFFFFFFCSCSCVLVAMATLSFHRFIMGKVKVGLYFYLTFLGKELFIRFIASAFRKLPSIYVFSYFPFGYEDRMWDLIVSVLDHCLSFYFRYFDKSFTVMFLK